MSTEEIVQRTRLLDSEIKVGSWLRGRQQSSILQTRKLRLREGVIHTQTCGKYLALYTATSSHWPFVLTSAVWTYTGRTFRKRWIWLDGVSRAAWTSPIIGP